MLEPPLVSVVIAVLNGEAYIDQAIESVLAQTYQRHEIVVVDGGSTDRSIEIALSYPGVRCIDQVGTGFAGAWNEGIEASSGELLSILDSDDLWMPEKLEKQTEILANDPTIDWVISRMRFILEPGHSCPPGFLPKLLEGDHEANMPSALLIRRTAFEAVGPFRADYSVANDIEWFARAKDLPLTLAIVPEVLVHKRVHNRNLSLSDLSADVYNHEMLDIVRQTVKRQQQC